MVSIHGAKIVIRFYIARMNKLERSLSIGDSYSTNVSIVLFCFRLMCYRWVGCISKIVQELSDFIRFKFDRNERLNS